MLVHMYAAGDIDFMLVPPASMGKLPCGPLLQRLLKQLLQVGLLVDELEPTRLRVPAEHEGSASWMGIARPAGSPHFRRIDIKVYPRRSALALVLHLRGTPLPPPSADFAGLAWSSGGFKSILAGLIGFTSHDPLPPPPPPPHLRQLQAPDLAVMCLVHSNVAAGQNGRCVISMLGRHLAFEDRHTLCC